MLQDLLKGLRLLAFPRNCAYCRRGPLADGQLLCDTCVNTLPLNKPPFCSCCGTHLAHFTTTGLCADCPKQGSLDQSWFVCHYKEPLESLIQQFKYNNGTRLMKIFGPMLEQFIRTYHIPIKQCDMIIPMALHSAKYRERGYNQAYLLANSIAQGFNLPLHNYLERTRLTESQTRLSIKDRWTNQEGTFTMAQSAHVQSKRILIVDDLTTSGATAQTAARLLKQAGAANVYLLTLAKA